jgi:hypothetical protein
MSWPPLTTTGVAPACSPGSNVDPSPVRQHRLAKSSSRPVSSITHPLSALGASGLVKMVSTIKSRETAIRPGLDDDRTETPANRTL